MKSDGVLGPDLCSYASGCWQDAIDYLHAEPSVKRPHAPPSNSS